MPIPESARRVLLDASRFLRFKTAVSTLVAFDASGNELFSTDHAWHLRAWSRQENPNSYRQRLSIVEDDGVPLDDFIAQVKTFVYKTDDDPPVVSPTYAVMSADAPETAINREWTIWVSREKAKATFFRPER